MPDGSHTLGAEDFARLEAAARERGPAAMFDELAATLVAEKRWHALFDLRLVQARQIAGLPLTAAHAPDEPAARELLEQRSVAACREVGQGLLADGQVAAAWMYLRAAPPENLPEQLRVIAEQACGELSGPGQELTDEQSQRVDELLGVALWESVDPALGIDLMLRTQGTCAAITAFEQTVSRLPARKQDPAARRLVEHLHQEVVEALVAGRSKPKGEASAAAETAPLVTAMDRGSEPAAAAPLVVDVSHLQSVLRIARVCSDEATLRRAWELAVYAARLPADLTYPGEPPFEQVGEASRRFFGAALGIEVAEAIAFFRKAAAVADPAVAGTLPIDTLVLVLARAGRAAEALHAAVTRGPGVAAPSPMQTAGQLPSLVELAAASGEWEFLLDACRRHGDAITFAAALAAREAPA